MHDILNRRLRTKGCPSGKNVKLGGRDIQVLSLLYRYRILSSKNITDHLKPKSTKRFTERLGQLYHDTGLIDRPVEQWNLAKAQYAAIVYSLSAKGKHLLDTEYQLPLKAVVYPANNVGGERQQFQHTLQISQSIHNAELDTIREPQQRFVPLDEIRNRQLSRGKQFNPEFPVTIPISQHNPHSVCRTTVRPDGLYGIEYTETDKKLYRFFAVEIERTSPKRRSSLKLSSTLKKKLAYEAAIKSGRYKAALGVPNIFPEF